MVLQRDDARNSAAASHPIYVNGRPIYRVHHSVLQKSMRDKHFLRSPRAISVDTSVIALAEELGATSCEFKHTETGDVYRAPLSLLRDHGIDIDRRFGAQKALPLEYWSVNGSAPKRVPLEQA